jgi:hypothetical protein
LCGTSPSPFPQGRDDPGRPSDRRTLVDRAAVADRDRRECRSARNHRVEDATLIGSLVVASTVSVKIVPSGDWMSITSRPSIWRGLASSPCSDQTYDCARERRWAGVRGLARGCRVPELRRRARLPTERSGIVDPDACLERLLPTESLGPVAACAAIDRVLRSGTLPVPLSPSRTIHEDHDICFRFISRAARSRHPRGRRRWMRRQRR